MYALNPKFPLPQTVLSGTPERRFLVAPSPLRPMLLRSPDTKLVFVQGSIPRPTMTGVRQAVRLSGANTFTACIRLISPVDCRVSKNVLTAPMLLTLGAAPPLVTTL